MFYLSQTFVPIRLLPFYRHPFLNISFAETILCAAILLAVSGFVWSRRKQPGVVAGALWFLGTLVPVIGLVQLGSAARADRYTYFPHIGLFMMLGRILLQLQPTVARRFGYALAGCAIILMPMTFIQASRWENSMTLGSIRVRLIRKTFAPVNYSLCSICPKSGTRKLLPKRKPRCSFRKIKMPGGLIQFSAAHC